MINETEITSSESGNEDAKKFLLSDESFNLLKSSQEKVKQATDIIPSLRKLINELVNPESVEKITLRFIEKLK